ncbi:polysaccharide deacetylase family protein [uncultured Tenacibaculum sp.]|uniref:polysaccharide deacetylase family protein n=1 Tax=uncultured Tenacibaculum sp. TaxID=174713 RepID=UPI002613E6E2|nr:polysaccharide deacetylase family protein [uncultured Tenacibaculum sp.]
MEIRIDLTNKYTMSELSVVMYHYVREIKNSSFPDIKGLELKDFREQIKYLKENYNFITTEELIESVYNNYKLPPKSVLLTFDDGYVDHYTNVFPILKEFGIQGSFYIPAKTVKEHKVLDVNKIHFILASVPDKSKIVADIKDLLIDIKERHDINDFEYYYKKLAIESRYDTAEVIFIKRLLQVELEEEIRMEIVDFLFKKYLKVSEPNFAKQLYLNEDQIKEMISEGMHIGCHGYNHYWWNRLKPNELEKEIDLSLDFLESLGVDLSNWTAAYPYGSHNEDVEIFLEKKKCKLAFTTKVGIENASLSNRLQLKRLDTNDITKEQLLNKRLL